MTDLTLRDWLTTHQAEELTGYTAIYLRRLANQGLIEARKVGRDWLINLEGLAAYKARMDALGPQRHNPWREDLARQGRGRGQPIGKQPNSNSNQGGNR